MPLAPKEGVALLNSGAFSTSLAALALSDATRLADALDVAGALDLEAFAANLTILHPRVAETRPYPGLVATVERLRSILAGSYLWEEGAARNLQDPLTFRCIAHMHGALRDVLAFARRAVDIELNASQDNPLPVPDERRIVSVANFDVLPLAAALDYLRIGLAPVIAAACERSIKLLQGHLTGLPEGLAPRSGLAENSLSEFGVTAQALAAEARLLAQPVSYELVSTMHAEGIEDRMTMAPLAARRLAEMVLAHGAARRHRARPRRPRRSTCADNRRSVRQPDGPMHSCASASRSWARATRSRTISSRSSSSSEAVRSPDGLKP